MIQVVFKIMSKITLRHTLQPIFVPFMKHDKPDWIHCGRQVRSGRSKVLLYQKVRNMF
jgi:hypothetical protein